MNPDLPEPDRVDQLVEQIAAAMKANYLKGPDGRGRVFEALNALAVSAAFVIAGTDDPYSLEYFLDGLQGQLEHLKVKIATIHEHKKDG